MNRLDVQPHATRVIFLSEKDATAAAASIGSRFLNGNRLHASVYPTDPKKEAQWEHSVRLFLAEGSLDNVTIDELFGHSCDGPGDKPIADAQCKVDYSRGHDGSQEAQLSLEHARTNADTRESYPVLGVVASPVNYTALDTVDNNSIGQDEDEKVDRIDVNSLNVSEIAVAIREKQLSQTGQNPSSKQNQRSKESPDDRYAKPSIGLDSSGRRARFGSQAQQRRPPVSEARVEERSFTLQGAGCNSSTAPSTPSALGQNSFKEKSICASTRREKTSRQLHRDSFSSWQSDMAKDDQTSHLSHSFTAERLEPLFAISQSGATSNNGISIEPERPDNCGNASTTQEAIKFRELDRYVNGPNRSSQRASSALGRYVHSQRDQV